MLSRFAAITRISRPWRRLLNRRRTAHAPAQAGPDLLSFAFAAKRRSRRHRGSLAPWTSTRRLGVGSAGFCFAMAKRASAEPSAGLSRFVQGDSTEPVGRDDRFAIEAVVTGHRHLTATRRGPPPATLRLLRQPNGFEGFAAVHVAHAAKPSKPLGWRSRRSVAGGG